MTEFEKVLAETLRSVLDRLQSAKNSHTEAHLVWRRESNTHRIGTLEQRPTISPLLRGFDWQALGARLDAILVKEFPQLRELIGTSSTGWSKLTGARLLPVLIWQLWRRWPDFLVGDCELFSFCAEISKDLTRETIELEFVAPVVNLLVDRTIESIDLGGQWTLKYLSEQEFSELYGGPVERVFIHRSDPSARFDWAVVGRFAEAVSNPTDRAQESEFDRSVRPRLQRLVLALRTFRSGPIGLSEIWVRPVGFTALVLAEHAIGLANEYVPRRVYSVAAADVGAFVTHYQRLESELHPALEVALGRLADASG